MAVADQIAVAHFGSDASCAGEARTFVSTTLLHWGCDAIEYLATLLVSELVANVVLHAGTDVEVVIRQTTGRVRLEVHDGDPHLPVRKWYSPTATTGRGMALIEELSHRWGAQTTSTGKVVWCELTDDSSSALAASFADEIDAEARGEAGTGVGADHSDRTSGESANGPRPFDSSRTWSLVSRP